MNQNLQNGDLAQLIDAMKKQNELYGQMLVGLIPRQKTERKENRRNVLKFTKKEISEMPTSLTKAFAVNDMVVRYRLKPDGVYEARIHRKGIHIEVSSKDLTTLKQKFIDRLTHYEENPKKKRDSNDKAFKEYADEWLNIKRVTTKESTYKEYVRMLDRDVLPVFGEMPVTEIDRTALQSFLLKYVDKGVLRTAHKLWLLLKCVFDMIADDYGIPTPMRKVVVPRFESKSGQAFTYEEEKQLVNHCLSTLDKDASHAFLVLLYAGLRRGELASMNVLDGRWLECKTSKERWARMSSSAKSRSRR